VCPRLRTLYDESDNLLSVGSASIALYLSQCHMTRRSCDLVHSLTLLGPLNTERFAQRKYRGQADGPRRPAICLGIGAASTGPSTRSG